MGRPVKLWHTRSYYFRHYFSLHRTVECRAAVNSHPAWMKWHELAIQVWLSCYSNGRFGMCRRARTVVPRWPRAETGQIRKPMSVHVVNTVHTCTVYYRGKLLCGNKCTCGLWVFSQCPSNHGKIAALKKKKKVVAQPLVSVRCRLVCTELHE